MRTVPAGGRARRAAAALVLAVCGTAALASCGRTITISDGPRQAAAPPAATAASALPPGGAAPGSAAPAGNTGLQIVDTTAAAAGLTGTGGTVVGAALQVDPPRWAQLTAVTSRALPSAHLVDVNGSTLYRFEGDAATPGRSQCNDACAVQWPPVTVRQGGNVYLSGVDPRQVGAIRRQDGGVQVTVGGRPVYRYAGDSRPGDLNGQGLGGTWFAVGPAGGRAGG
ncbi:hypothetical protein LO771_17010 [Streptacidiphilus sp. ASG 303]|uniref:COG4315 family predicted lipoprotein n=1 Tax=Streptacidiphilus sp. ASG 303 TaxID=2896847 RepID=UPI001E2B48F4|nr:hypothetical protein [Streptacidiphilus sp. ASG 303]MCD0484045.1 hypothetical protein [Streptacidiphilus sp. ASG 303]